MLKSTNFATSDVEGKVQNCSLKLQLARFAAGGRQMCPDSSFSHATRAVQPGQLNPDDQDNEFIIFVKK